MVAGSIFSAFLAQFFWVPSSNLKVTLPLKDHDDDPAAEEIRDRQDLLLDLMQNQSGLFDTDCCFEAALRYYPHRL